MSTAEKLSVKFLKGWRGYNAGEVAGFDPSVAGALIDGDVAEAVEGAESGGTKTARTEATTRKRGAKTPPGTGGEKTGEGSGTGTGDGTANGDGDTKPPAGTGSEGTDTAAPGAGGPPDNSDRP